MTYLANTWYAAAWTHELTDKVLARRIADEPVVLFRTDAGEIAALQDRCPHRFAPLSKGTKTGNTLACGYHGLAFDKSGMCVFNPYSSEIPAKARVRSFPATEMHGLIWLWFGDVSRADPTLIPDVSVLESSDWRAASGYMHVNVNYELLIDNLMDLSHAEFLHPTNLGLRGLAAGEFNVRHVGNSVEFSINTVETSPPPVFDFILSSEGQPVFFTVDARWDPPGVVHIHSMTKYADEARSKHVDFKGVHIVVPETERSSHYFYAGLRDQRKDDEELQVAIEAGLKLAFENEDKPMVEAAQGNMATPDLLRLDPVLLPLDGAAIRVRRRLKRLIAEEQQNPSASPDEDDRAPSHDLADMAAR